MGALPQNVVSLIDLKDKYMGKPQTEDGYTRIANELYDVILVSKFSGRQLKVLLAIIRKTYGFNKKADEIGLSQLRDMTGLARSHVSTTVAELTRYNVIFVSGGVEARTIAINKQYKLWSLPEEGKRVTKKITAGITETVTVTEKVTVTEIGTDGVTETVNMVLPKQEPQYTGLKDIKKTKAAAEKTASISIKSWLSAMKEIGEKAIRPEDPIFEYSERAGISDDMMRICWLEFRTQHLANNKRQKDWRAHFRNHVRGNWYRLWAFDSEGKAFLTSQGRQAMNVFKED